MHTVTTYMKTTMSNNYTIQQDQSLVASRLANTVTEKFNQSPLIPPPLTRRLDMNFVWAR